MRLTLQRFCYDPSFTLGRILEVGVWTLERPWKDNIVKASCVPEGVYEIKPDREGKYTGYPELQNVPGRTEIIIHVANWVHQLQGCIAPGMGYNYEPSVSRSREALKKLMDYAGDEWTLEITCKRAVSRET